MSYINAKKKNAYQKSSLHFIQSFFIHTIGVKIVETLLSFRVDFKLGAQMAPSPAPPRQCRVLLFSTSLVDSGTTLISVEEGGVSRKRTFWSSFLCKQLMCRCQCVLLETVSTNFVADCWFAFCFLLNPPCAVKKKMSEKKVTGKIVFVAITRGHKIASSRSRTRRIVSVVSVFSRRVAVP